MAGIISGRELFYGSGFTDRFTEELETICGCVSLNSLTKDFKSRMVFVKKARGRWPGLKGNES